MSAKLKVSTLNSIFAIKFNLKPKRKQAQAQSITSERKNVQDQAAPRSSATLPGRTSQNFRSHGTNKKASLRELEIEKQCSKGLTGCVTAAL